jgi:hypothetical protein
LGVIEEREALQLGMDDAIAGIFCQSRKFGGARSRIFRARSSI